MIDISEALMPMIVIFNKPLDFPHHYVARVFDMNKPTKKYIVAYDLETIRKEIPPHMTRIERDYSDDEVIVETWL